MISQMCKKYMCKADNKKTYRVCKGSIIYQKKDGSYVHEDCTCECHRQESAS